MSFVLLEVQPIMSSIDLWDDLYAEALTSGLQAVSEVPGVVLGIHSVIDGLKRVSAESIANAMRDITLRERVLASLDDVPREINSPVDMLCALVSSMMKGKAMQLMIRNQETADWIMSEFGYDTLRMGGTSGNMANSLSPLPFPRLVVYANPLTHELAELFMPSPNLFVLADDGQLKHPMEAAKGKGILALHWIFEYQAGEVVDIPGLSFTTPRANRFIAAWNPVNNKLQIDANFKKNLLSASSTFSHMVVSGFHILSESYPDGTTWRDYLVPVAGFLSELAGAAPKLQLHYEFASIASSQIRKGIVHNILPIVNSLGLNEVELIAVLRDLGENDIANSVEASGSIEAVYLGVKRLLTVTGLDRVQLHDLGYYLTITRQGYCDGRTSLNSMLMAATLAASRCLFGKIGTPVEIAEGLTAPVSSSGLDKLSTLSQYLSSDDLSASGYCEIDGLTLIMMPTRIVDRPVLTVGLGDIISSSAFILGSNR